jgi:glycosyltransferase A (GT-A) superfamily protein (DUF2064 family)
VVQLSAYSSIHDRKKRSRSNKNQQDGRIVSLRCPRVNGFHAPQSAILVGNVDLVLGLGQDVVASVIGLGRVSAGSERRKDAVGRN